MNLISNYKRWRIRFGWRINKRKPIMGQKRMNNLYFDPFSLRRRMIFSFLTHFPRATLDWLIGKLFNCHEAHGVINYEGKRCSGILNRTNRQIFCHNNRWSCTLRTSKELGRPVTGSPSWLSLEYSIPMMAVLIVGSGVGETGQIVSLTICHLFSGSLVCLCSLAVHTTGLVLRRPPCLVPSPNALPVLSHCGYHRH